MEACSVAGREPQVGFDGCVGIQNQLFSRMAGIDAPPARPCQQPDGSNHDGEESAEKHNQQARWKRFSLGRFGDVQDLDAGSLLGFLYFCELTLLGQELEYGLLDSVVAIKLGIRDT